jgi:opacity protein-like surface antigen
MKTKLAVSILAVLVPGLAAAQSAEPSADVKPKSEIIAGVALAHVFRFEDQGFGNHFNFGIGMDMPLWRKLRIGAEINRTFGFSPSPVKCGSILFSPGYPMPCTGSAREGVTSATAGSITAAWFFGKGRIQPYLLGGLSILNASEYRSASIVHVDHVEFTESEIHSTGIGPTLGAGLRASINRHFSIRPEIRFSDGTAYSRLNLSQWRLSIGAAYSW